MSELVEKECVVCGKKFKTNIYNKLTCSPKCQKVRTKELKREYNKKYSEMNADYLKAYRKKYYKTNKEVLNAQVKEWREKHPDYHKDYQKSYYDENQDKYLSNSRKVSRCALKHDNCFSCPTPDGECLYD